MRPIRKIAQEIARRNAKTLVEDVARLLMREIATSARPEMIVARKSAAIAETIAVDATIGIHEMHAIRVERRRVRAQVAVTVLNPRSEEINALRSAMKVDVTNARRRAE